MKKVIVFLSLIIFSTLSCTDKDLLIPQPEQDLTHIYNTFKAIKIIRDNLGKDSEKSTDELLALYNKEIKPNVARAVKENLASFIEHMKDSVDQTAVRGKAGLLEGRYMLDANGIDLSQFVSHGLMGAFQLNGFTVAFVEAVMGARTKKARKDALDKGVTYLLGDVSYLEKGKDVEGKYPVYDGNLFVVYMNEVSVAGKYKGIADRIYAALKDAYAKIEDRKGFREEMERAYRMVLKVVAFKGVYYLSMGEKLNNGFSAQIASEISKGLGFAYSLQFAYNMRKHEKYLNFDQAREFVGIDLWSNDTPQILTEKASTIAKTFGFSVSDVQ